MDPLMRTLIFGLFGICMFGATVFLFVLLIRALLKYLRHLAARAVRF